MDVRMSQRKRNRELRSLAGPVALRDDLTVMFFNDAVRNRQAESGTLPASAAREERLEQMLADFFSHPTTVIFDDQLGIQIALSQRDGDSTARIYTIQRIRDEIEDHLFHFLRAELNNNGIAVAQDNVF